MSPQIPKRIFLLFQFSTPLILNFLVQPEFPLGKNVAVAVLFFCFCCFCYVVLETLVNGFFTLSSIFNPIFLVWQLPAAVALECIFMPLIIFLLHHPTAFHRHAVLISSFNLQHCSLIFALKLIQIFFEIHKKKKKKKRKKIKMSNNS